MALSRLPSYGGNEPVWSFVAQIAEERFSGHAIVGLTPRVHLWAQDGFVYFAERVGATPLPERLVASGALTGEQLAAGSIIIDGEPSIGRLFQRCPDIDRDVVELTVRITTEGLLSAIAEAPVGMPEVHPLRHHPAGLHLWLRPIEENTAAAARDHSRPIERPPIPAPVETDLADDLQAIGELTWATAEPEIVAEPATAPVIEDAPQPAPEPFEWPESTPLAPSIEPAGELEAPPPLRSLAFLAALDDEQE